MSICRSRIASRSARGRMRLSFMKKRLFGSVWLCSFGLGERITFTISAAALAASGAVRISSSSRRMKRAARSRYGDPSGGSSWILAAKPVLT